jgi:hypothetical protein
MKNLRILAPLAVALAFCASAHAQMGNPTGKLKVDNVAVEMVKTPKYSFSDTKDKRSTPGDWVEIEVEFSAAEDLPEATVRVHVAFKQLMGAKKYFTGEATYINILKGKGKFAVLYMPPSALKAIDGGRVPAPGDIAEVGVELLDKGAVSHQFNAKGERTAWWQSFQPIQGQVLNKNQTPFAPLFWDRYEMLKIETR